MKTPIQTHTDARTWLEKLSDILLREPQDREQLVNLLRDAENRQLMDADALSMIEGVLNVSDLQARDIMIPRSQMTTISDTASIDEFLPTIIETAHSRFPVLNDDNKVVGIIHAKDLLQYSVDTKKEFNIRNILRPANVTPESKRLDKLLKDFRVTRNHMAVVVDEYGELAGIITIEDIIEQIVGEIEDEFDVNDNVYIKQRDDNDFIVKAITPIEDFNAHFSTGFSENEADTIGGHVLAQMGHIPKRDETLTVANLTFTVVNADTRHIRLLHVSKITD